MPITLLKNATIVTGASVVKGTLGIEGELISGIWKETPNIPGAEVIDVEGCLVMAGGIDAHVHFREPGMTHKADIGSEPLAAVIDYLFAEVGALRICAKHDARPQFRQSHATLRHDPRGNGNHPPA